MVILTKFTDLISNLLVRFFCKYNFSNLNIFKCYLTIPTINKNCCNKLIQQNNIPYRDIISF